MGDSIQPFGQRSQASNDRERVNDNAASMSPIENGTSKAMREDTEPLDDQGTAQEDAVELLQVVASKAEVNRHPDVSKTMRALAGDREIKVPNTVVKKARSKATAKT